jgi:hypothetical protein
VPTWIDSPQVRVAIRISGWPNCSVVDFLHALGEVLAEMDDLVDKGIRFPDLVGLCSEVWCAEGQSETPDRCYTGDPGRQVDYREGNQPGSSEARRAIRKLWLHGFDLVEIAKLTQVDVDKVGAYLDWARMEESSRKVIRLHLAGELISKIADECGMSRTRAGTILSDAGYTPNLGRQPKADAGLRARILALREQGRSVNAIAKELDISVDRCKNIVYPRKRS